MTFSFDCTTVHACLCAGLDLQMNCCLLESAHCTLAMFGLILQCCIDEEF